MAFDVTPTKASRIEFNVRPGALANPYWYDRATSDPGPGMVALARQIDHVQSWRRTQNLRMARLYQDRRVASVFSTTGSGLDETGPMRVSWNIIRAACDVAHARVGRNRSRVMFVSVDGDWSLRRKARLRTRFADGAFRQANVYEEWRRVFLDACVYGVGILHVFSEDGELRSERVIPDEVVVDPGEGLYGRPPTIYRRKTTHRREVLRTFGDEKNPSIKAAILGAAPSDTRSDKSPTQVEMIDVWEGWRLPSGDEKGRHVVAIDGVTLLDEPWTRPRFPLVPFRWGDALAGWYGLGIAEQLEGAQLEIRRTLHTIQQGHYHGSQFKVFVPNGAKMTAQQFNNDPRGAVLFYDGPQPPTYVAPSGVNPELPGHLMRLWQQGFDQVGLPPSGSGAVPTNIKSGEGIRAYTEAVDSRLAVPSQRCDQFFVDVAEVMLDEVREMGGLKVESKVGRTYQRIDWRDIADGDNDFILQAWPAGLLPATPSGKYDRLNEMVQSGWISKEQALSILDVPDLESVVSLETSSYELIGRALERMLDESIPEVPEPYQNLDLSLRIAQDAYLKARADGAPEANLRLVREYIDAIRDLQGQQSPPPAPAAPPGMPPGMPPEMGAMGAPPAMPPGAPPPMPTGPMNGVPV